MEYSHFGKQAEVWKHLPLSEVIFKEKPLVYIETNSAYADYKLINETIKDKIRQSAIRDYLCKEIIMEIIGEDTIQCNPGIMGSGLLASNLSRESFDIIEKYSSLLVDLWKDTQYLNHKGDLYQETIK